MNKDYTFEVNETVNSFINSLSDDELRSIINDTDQESRLEELTQKSQTVSKLKQEKEMLIAKNKSLADYNYGREPTYNDLRKVLEDAHKQAIELKQTLLEKQTKLNRLKPQMTPDTLRSLLQVAAQESEEQSEEIAKQYLSSEKAYEDFIKEYIKERTEYHVRRIKYEKLIDSIQNPAASSLNQNNSSSSINRPNTVLNQNTANNNQIQSNHLPPSSVPYPPTVSNAPFAYQPFNTSAQPIRSAPLPPHMIELPPYPYGAVPVQAPNVYPPPQNILSYPFNINPNFR